MRRVRQSRRETDGTAATPSHESRDCSRRTGWPTAAKHTDRRLRDLSEIDARTLPLACGGLGGRPREVRPRPARRDGPHGATPPTRPAPDPRMSPDSRCATPIHPYQCRRGTVRTSATLCHPIHGHVTWRLPKVPRGATHHFTIASNSHHSDAAWPSPCRRNGRRRTSIRPPPISRSPALRVTRTRPLPRDSRRPLCALTGSNQAVGCNEPPVTVVAAVRIGHAHHRGRDAPTRAPCRRWLCRSSSHR